MKVGREVRKLPFLHGNDIWRRSLQELVRAVEFVTVRWSSLRSAFSSRLGLSSWGSIVHTIFHGVIGQVGGCDNVVY
jgi:hypothetical protein